LILLKRAYFIRRYFNIAWSRKPTQLLFKFW
jgi:hypothetical protein